MDGKLLKYLVDVVTLAQFSNAAQMRLVNFKELQPYFEKLDNSLNSFWNLGVSESVDMYAVSNYSQHLENLVSIVIDKYGVEKNAFKTILDANETYLVAFYKSIVSRIALATYNVTLESPSKNVLVEFEKLVRNLPTVFNGHTSDAAVKSLSQYFISGTVTVVNSAVASPVDDKSAAAVSAAPGLNAQLNVQFNSGVCSIQLTPAQGSELKTSVAVGEANSAKEVEADVAKLVGELVSGWVKLNSKSFASEVESFLAEKQKEKERINAFAQELAKLTPEQAQALAQAVMQNANWNMVIKTKE